MSENLSNLLETMAITASGKASSLAPHAEEVRAALEKADLLEPGTNLAKERARILARNVAGDVEESRLLRKAVSDGRADARFIYQAEIEGYIASNPDSRIARAENLRKQVKEARAKARLASK